MGFNQATTSKQTTRFNIEKIATADESGETNRSYVSSSRSIGKTRDSTKDHKLIPKIVHYKD